MTEDLILKLRELISTAKYEEALHLCDMELSLLDLNNCDKEWLARIYFFKGATLLSLGNKEDSLIFYNLAIENNNNYHQAYYNRGVANFIQNHVITVGKEQAVLDFQVGLNLLNGYKKDCIMFTTKAELSTKNLDIYK